MKRTVERQGTALELLSQTHMGLELAVGAPSGLFLQVILVAMGCGTLSALVLAPWFHRAAIALGASELAVLLFGVLMLPAGLVATALIRSRARPNPAIARRSDLAHQLLARVIPFNPTQVTTTRLVVAAPYHLADTRAAVAITSPIKGGAELTLEVFEDSAQPQRYSMTLRLGPMPHQPGMAHMILPGPLEAPPQVTEATGRQGGHVLEMTGIRPAKAIDSQDGAAGVLLAEIVTRVLATSVPILLGEHRGLRHLVSGLALEPEIGPAAVDGVKMPVGARAALAIPRPIARPPELTSWDFYATQPRLVTAIAALFAGALGGCVLVPPMVGAAWALCCAGVALGLVREVLRRRKLRLEPRIRKDEAGDPALGLVGDSLCAGGDVDGGIDGTRHFSVVLTRSSDEGGGDYLGVELTQRRPDTPCWNRLRLRVPVTATSALLDLPNLKSRAAVVDPVATRDWLWSWIVDRAAGHGQKLNLRF